VSSTTDQQLLALPVAELRSLNTCRNDLAHGHFDQNPYDGTYQLIKAKKIKDYPVERIAALTDELAKIVEYLLSTEILYGFEELTVTEIPHGFEDLTIQPAEKGPA
jgi:hypothetical protein